MSTRRLPRSLLAVTLCGVLAAGLCGAQGVQAGVTAREDGASGIGDPYWPLDGNGGIDVASYRIHNRYALATKRLSGRTTVSFTATATADLSSFSLDFLLPVRKVTVDGVRARFSRSGRGHELRITPSRALPPGSTHTAVVTYAGNPAKQDYAGERNWLASTREVVTMNQPHMAPWWFPANDHPLDKAIVDVRITVPKGREVVSNGKLRGRQTGRRGTTWHWRAAEPMAPYMVVLAIGEFDLRAYEADGIQFWDALDPDLSTPLPAQPDQPALPPPGVTAQASLARQPEVIGFLAGIFGPYPFSSGGGIVDDPAELSAALETQTRPIYASRFFADPIGGDLVVVHELAHQWAGDLVRLAGWQHLWLNEGFATYAEWLWLEREGLVTVQQQFDVVMSDLLPADDPFWTVLPGDPGPDTLFSGAVHLRGALTLHGLRQAVGDDDFFRILRTWISSRAGTAVTTADFVALAEQESGRDLDALFQTWLYTAGKPAT